MDFDKPIPDALRRKLHENQEKHFADNVTDFPPPPPQPDLLIGPFQEWRVVVEGKLMPHLTGFREGDKYWLVVDHRLASGPFDEEQARQAARLAGNAMAVATGYPWLGADERRRPFAPGCGRLPEGLLP